MVSTRVFVLLLLSLFSLAAYARVGINTANSDVILSRDPPSTSDNYEDEDLDLEDLDDGDYAYENERSPVREPEQALPRQELREPPPPRRSPEP